MGYREPSVCFGRRGFGEELAWWGRDGGGGVGQRGRGGGRGVHKIVASTRERDPQRQRLCGVAGLSYETVAETDTFEK